MIHLFSIYQLKSNNYSNIHSWCQTNNYISHCHLRGPCLGSSQGNLPGMKSRYHHPTMWCMST